MPLVNLTPLSQQHPHIPLHVSRVGLSQYSWGKSRVSAVVYKLLLPL